MPFDPAEIVREIRQVEEQRAALKLALDTLYAELREATQHKDRVDLGEGRSVLVEHTNSVRRTKWRHADVWDEVVKRARFDRDGTHRDPEDAMQALLDAVPVAVSLGWKVQGLRELGIAPEDYCIEEKKPSVRIIGGEQ